MATDAMLAKLADGTRATYRGGWRSWLLWRQLRGDPPCLQGETRDERLADEDDLIRYVVHLYNTMGLRATTIRQRLFAIRYAHSLAGFGDVAADRRRLWTAMEGLKRWDGKARRKLPATPRMLRWLKDYLFNHGAEPHGEAVVLWAALMTGYFFMLRASEYLVQPEKAWSLDRVVQGRDLQGLRDGTPEGWLGHCDEVVLAITSSKTDQYNAGCHRNHFRSARPLCVVEALAGLQREYP